MADSTPPASDPSSTDGTGGLEAQGLQKLLEVTRRINAAVDHDDVLQSVVDSLVAIVRADRGFLMLRDLDSGELVFTIARDKKGQPLEQKKFRVSQSVISEVA